MSENHTLETVLSDIGTEPVPEDVHQLSDRVVEAFRRSLSDDSDAVNRGSGGLIDAHMPVRASVAQPVRVKGSTARVHRMVKIAAAIVIVVGLGGVLAWWMPGPRKSGIVFADVVQHFTKARTAKYTVVIELEGRKPVTIKKKQDFEHTGWGSPWDHSGPMGIQMLPRDWARCPAAADPMSEGFEGETLYFFGQADGEGIQDFFEVMGQVHAQAEAALGDREIDGRPATGFRFEQDGSVYSIWASAATGLPLQIEIINARLLGGGKVTLRDFMFDVDIPKPAMGMGGVVFREWKWSVSEDALVDALRRWAKRHDGRFPAYLVHQAWFFNTPEYFRNPDLSVEDRQKVFSLSAQVIIRGLMFASQLPAGDDWHYVGKGMTCDAEDSAAPICWYRPAGSNTYRVIYRNLTVCDVAPDTLPSATVTQ